MPTDSQDVKTVKRATVAQTVIQAGMLAELEAQRLALAEQTDLLRAEQADREIVAAETRNRRAERELRDSDLAWWRDAVAETEIALGKSPLEGLSVLLDHKKILTSTPQDAPLEERVRARRLLAREPALFDEVEKTSTLLRDIRARSVALDLPNKINTARPYFHTASDQGHHQFNLAFNATAHALSLEEAETQAEQYLAARTEALEALRVWRMQIEATLRQVVVEGPHFPIVIALVPEVGDYLGWSTAIASQIEADIEEKRTAFQNLHAILRRLIKYAGKIGPRDFETWNQAFNPPNGLFTCPLAENGFVYQLDRLYRNKLKASQDHSVQLGAAIVIGVFGMLAFFIILSCQ